MLAEWHVTPDYIVNNWTDELLDLMVEKLAERKGRENESRDSGSLGQTGNTVSVEALAARSRGLIELKQKENQ